MQMLGRYHYQRFFKFLFFVVYLECRSSPCKNGGRCVQYNDGVTCHCKAGFTGKYCGQVLTSSSLNTYGVGKHCDPTENDNSSYQTLIELLVGSGDGKHTNSLLRHEDTRRKRQISKRKGTASCIRDRDCSLDNTFICNPITQKYQRCDTGILKGQLHTECRNHTCHCKMNSSSHVSTSISHQCFTPSDCAINSCGTHKESHCVDNKCACIVIQNTQSVIQTTTPKPTFTPAAKPTPTPTYKPTPKTVLCNNDKDCTESNTFVYGPFGSLPCHRDFMRICKQGRCTCNITITDPNQIHKTAYINTKTTSATLSGTSWLPITRDPCSGSDHTTCTDTVVHGCELVQSFKGICSRKEIAGNCKRSCGLCNTDAALGCRGAQ